MKIPIEYVYIRQLLNRCENISPFEALYRLKICIDATKQCGYEPQNVELLEEVINYHFKDWKVI